MRYIPIVEETKRCASEYMEEKEVKARQFLAEGSWVGPFFGGTHSNAILEDWYSTDCEDADRPCGVHFLAEVDDSDTGLKHAEAADVGDVEFDDLLGRFERTHVGLRRGDVIRGLRFLERRIMVKDLGDLRAALEEFNGNRERALGAWKGIYEILLECEVLEKIGVGEHCGTLSKRWNERGLELWNSSLKAHELTWEVARGCGIGPELCGELTDVNGTVMEWAHYKAIWYNP